MDLQKALKEGEENGKKRLAFKRLDPFDFVINKSNPTTSQKAVCSMTSGGRCDS